LVRLYSILFRLENKRKSNCKTRKEEEKQEKNKKTHVQYTWGKNVNKIYDYISMYRKFGVKISLISNY